MGPDKYNNYNNLAMFKLLVDTREKLGIPDMIREKFGDNDVLKELIIKSLDAGDYQILQDDKPIAIIERKTLNDLSASMGDDRRNNINNLLLERHINNCDLYYLIEGPAFPSGNKKFSRKPYKMLESYIFRLMAKYKINIIKSKNPEHTSHIITKLFNKYYDVHMEDSENILKHMEDSQNILKHMEDSQNILNNMEDSDGTMDNSSDINSEMVVAGGTDITLLPNNISLRCLDDDAKIVCKMWMSIKSINTERAINKMAKYSIVEYLEMSQKENSGIKLPSYTQCIMLSRIPGISLNSAKVIMKYCESLLLFNNTDNSLLRYQITPKTKLSNNKIIMIKKYINFKLD